MPPQAAAQLGRLTGGVNAATKIARQASGGGQQGTVPSPAAGPQSINVKIPLPSLIAP
jgi:hypothetical protein